MRSYRGATAAERAEARRARLIAAGIEVYGQVGYRRATVKAVCAAAGLTDRYFYEAFDNSEALLAACFETVTGDVMGIIARAEAAEPGTADRRARAMLEAFFAVLQRERPRARVFLLEMAGISETVDRAFEGMLALVGARVAQVLDPAGVGPVARDPILARGLAAGVVGIAVAWIRGDCKEPVEAVAGAAMKLCALARP